MKKRYMLGTPKTCLRSQCNGTKIDLA